MAYTKSHFVNNTVITAAGLKTPLDNARTAINGGVVSADLASGSWVERTQIYGPDFFLSPDPRSDFTSAQTHWRMHPSDTARAAYFNKQAAKEKTWVPGLTATVKIESTSDVFIIASWFAREFENKNKETTHGNGDDSEFDNFHCASFNLSSLTGTTMTDYEGTFRRVYTSLMDNDAVHTNGRGGIFDWMVGSGKQYSIAYRVKDVAPGIYTFGMRIDISKTDSNSPGQVRNIQVSNRSFIVDIHPSS
tara:strand:+ start:6122 stop:6865 length:744 start_codon:yes stop_codon:yes gene_type:complete